MGPRGDHHNYERDIILAPFTLSEKLIPELKQNKCEMSVETYSISSPGQLP